MSLSHAGSQHRTWHSPLHLAVPPLFKGETQVDGSSVGNGSGPTEVQKNEGGWSIAKSSSGV